MRISSSPDRTPPYPGTKSNEKNPRYNRDDSPPPRRYNRDDSPPPRRYNRDDSPPPRRYNRDDSPPPRRYNRDDSPPRRYNRDDSPPRRYNRDDSPPSYRRNDSPPSYRRNDGPKYRRTDRNDEPRQQLKRRRDNTSSSTLSPKRASHSGGRGDSIPQSNSTRTPSISSTSTQQTAYPFPGWGNVVNRGGEGNIRIGNAPTTQSPTSLPLNQLGGTHASVAPIFSDKKTVQGTVDQLVKNPNLVQTEPFRLTVFNATRPGDETGPLHTWSANNRRLSAMQQADQILRSENRGGLPNIPVTWGGQQDVEHAIRPGAFNNNNRAQVSTHNTGTRVQRFANVSNANRAQAPQIDTNRLQVLTDKAARGGTLTKEEQDEYSKLLNF